MLIRLAVHADVPDIARVVACAYTKYIARIGREPAPMGDDHAARVEAGTAWVAEHDGQVIGLVVLLPKKDHLLLDNIAVDPRRAGQGHGRALLAFAEAHARKLGFAELRLYTNAAMHENVAHYTKSGWQETGRAGQDGFSRVFFRKPVSA